MEPQDGTQSLKIDVQMAEEILSPEVQQDPPLKQLWNSLRQRNKNFTRSYEDFQVDMQNDDARYQLHTKLRELDPAFNRTFDDFSSDIGFKKKDSTRPEGGLQTPSEPLPIASTETPEPAQQPDPVISENFDPGAAKLAALNPAILAGIEKFNKNVGKPFDPEGMRADFDKQRAEEQGARDVITGIEQKYRPEQFQEKNPFVTGAKSIWNTLAYQLPAAGASFGAILNPETPLMGGKPLMTQKEMEDYKKSSIASKAALLEWSKEHQGKGSELTKDLTQRMDKINDPLDVLNYVFYATGQAAGQVPLSVATLGGSSIVQEVGSIYSESVNRIANEKGLTIQEVLEKDLDSPAVALTYGVIAGLADRVGAGAVMKPFTKGMVKSALRNRVMAMAKGGSIEGATEYAQTALEQIGAAHGSGKTFGESLEETVKDRAKSKERIEATVQGILGGGALSGITSSLTPKQKVNETLTGEQQPTVEETTPAAEPTQQTDTTTPTSTTGEPGPDTAAASPDVGTGDAQVQEAPQTEISPVESEPKITESNATIRQRSSEIMDVGQQAGDGPTVGTRNVQQEIAEESPTEKASEPQGDVENTPEKVEITPELVDEYVKRKKEHPSSNAASGILDVKGLRTIDRNQRIAFEGRIVKAFLERDLPSKAFSKKETIDLDVVPKDANINIKPIKTKVKSKSPIESLQEITLKDDSGRAMTGVYHDADNKALVATNGFALVKIPDQSIIENKIVRTDKLLGDRVLNEKFPRYTEVVPESNPIKVENINLQEWLDKASGIARANKFIDNDYQGRGVLARFNVSDQDIFVDPKYLKSVLTTLSENGVKNITAEFNKPNKAILFKADNGIVGLLMPVQNNNERPYSTVYEEALQPNQEETVPEETVTLQQASEKGIDKAINWLDDIDKKLTDFGKETLGVNVPIVVAQAAVRTAKATLQAGKTVAEAIESAIQSVRDSDWFKSLPKEEQADAEKKVRGIFTGETSVEKQPEEKPEQKLSGIKKALVPEEKITATDIEKRTPEEMLALGRQLVDDGTINPKAIVTEIAEGNARALQPAEVAALVYYKAQLDNKIDAAQKTITRAQVQDNYENELAGRAELSQLNKDLDDYHVMSLKTAYEQSLAFRLRKMLLDDEYNLQTQINKYKVASGGVIPLEVEAKFRQYDRELKEANDRLKELEKEIAERDEKEAIENIKQASERQKKKGKPAIYGKTRIAKGMEDLASALGAVKFASGTERISAVRALTDIGLGLIEEGIATAENVIEKLSEHIKEKFKGKVSIDEYRDEVESNIKSALLDESTTGAIKIKHSLIRDLVESGVDNIQDLTARVKELIKEEYPDATDREVRDAITQYGKTVNLSQDEIDVEIRKMKRIGRLISAIEDVRKGKRPSRSGLQRDKPDVQERAMRKDLNEMMKDLPMDEADIQKQWETALGAIKSRLKNAIEDLQRRIDTGVKPTNKRAQVALDQEAKDLAAERDRLKEVVKQLEGDPEMTAEQKAKMALRLIENAAEEVERRIRENDLEYAQKKAPVDSPEIRAARQRLEDLRGTLKKMREDAGIVEKRRLEYFKTRVRRRIAEMEDRMARQDFAPRKKNAPVSLDQEAKDLEAKKILTKEKFDHEHEKLKLSQRSKIQKFWDGFVEMVGLTKTLVTIMDMSAPFRQGIVFSFSRPLMTVKAFGEMFRQAFSQQNADMWLAHIKSSPEYPLMKASGLYLSEPNAKLTAREESYMVSNWAKKIPGYGAIIKASERSYVAFLNKQRVDAFLSVAEKFSDLGIDPKTNPEEYKAWADYVNNATGRGSLGEFEQAAKGLSTIFFSPRLITSRFNILLNAKKYAEMPPAARKEALKSTLTFIGVGLTAVGLAAMAGADVEDDPRSADFGKIKIGNTRIDPWGGFVQWVVLLSRLYTNERKSTTTGKIEELGKRMGADDRVDLLLNFFKQKLAPAPAMAVKYAESKVKDGKRTTRFGEEIDPVEDLKSAFIPLYLRDLDKLYEEHDPVLASTLGLMSFFGFGIQQYGQPKKTESKPSPRPY